MPVRGEGLRPDDDDGDNAAETAAGDNDEGGRVVYVLHPNCAVEEM